MLETKINYSLDNVQAAFDELAPYDFKTIHIAGTNGKGSTCTFLELLYLVCLPEIKVGKYTSPHIWSITERFSTNGKDIPEIELTGHCERMRSNPVVAKRGLTEFEFKTLVAYEYFKAEQVDVAILETGLGGRLDATNVIPAEQRLATAITNVGMDHMDFLGNSIEGIRREKEGIKAEGVPHFEPVVIATLSEEKGKQSPNSAKGANFLLALKIFESINNLKVTEEQKEEVLKKLPQRYRARFEYQDGVLLDAAHNPAAMTELNRFIRKDLPGFERRIFVLAFLDKDYQTCLENLFENLLDPDQDLVILTEVDSLRATPSFLLDELIDANKMIITDPKEAIQTAQELKKESDLLIIAGSVMLLNQAETK
ncbi:MAG: Mur ligase family protein [Candidatus Melainabacteria bacterium]|nr:Mur ligase family protein [Candidatus Melainabacteria bacterium]